MAKVNFEFDDNEDNNDIQLIVNRNKLMRVVYDLDDLYRKIYNYKINENDQVSVKDNKILTDEDYKKANKPITETKSYLSQSFIENELDSILQNVRFLIE